MILQNEFAREPAALKSSMLSAIQRVLDSGWYILGREVEQFESEWARFVGARCSTGVGNGHDAIEIGLRASQIGSGDEIVTTPMTAFATVLAILRVGAVPVFADIAPDTANLDFASVLRCVTRRTRGVMLVHLYGRLSDMSLWSRTCADAGIRLWEDCAQAHGATLPGGAAGTWGEWGAYSFYPTKNLGAIGDAGALVTNDEAIDQKARQIRNYGQRERYHHVTIGENSRLDELQAALLRERLPYLSACNDRRRAVAQLYHKHIDNPLVRKPAPPVYVESHVYHLFVVNCARRAKLIQHLAEREIQPQIHYPIPAHLQLPCKHLPRDPCGLKRAEEHAETCLSLPCHPYMTEQEVYRVIDAVNGFQG